MSKEKWNLELSEYIKQGFKIEKRDIDITSSLSSLGMHNVDINLFKEIKATIKIHLVK